MMIGPCLEKRLRLRSREVHDTPNLLSADPSALRIFVNQVKSLYAKAVECRPDQWIVHAEDKQQLAYQPSECTVLPKGTNLFIQKWKRT